MPRKTFEELLQRLRVLAASMRPRPDAAENHRERLREFTAAMAASMRPRPDAAENAFGVSMPALMPSELQ